MGGGIFIFGDARCYYVAFGNSSIESKQIFCGYIFLIHKFCLCTCDFFIFLFFMILYFFFNILFIFHRSASLIGSCPKVALA
jgi:hypothetical protein